MDELEPILLMVVGGFLIRYSLIFAGQTWAKSYAQTVSFVVLPIITYVITKTISGNIAFSLGMIGALSIVRFRTPIKEPEDLVYLFYSLAIGLGLGAGRQDFTIIMSLIVFAFIIIRAKFKSKDENIINSDLLKYITENIKTPVMVGGGINSKEDIELLVNSGASYIVVGNILEGNTDFTLFE